MFDIGFWEIMLILVIGLVVLGPERMPAAIYTVTSWIRKIRQLAAGVQQEVEREFQLKKLREEVQQAELRGLEKVDPELHQSLRELRQSAEFGYHPDMQQVAAYQPVEDWHEESSSTEAPAVKDGVEGEGKHD